MSRSATPATRNEATRRLKPTKSTPSAELTIGTAIRGSRERLRTVAKSCGCKRNVERTHPQPPDPQSETGTLATHSGKKPCFQLQNDHQITIVSTKPALFTKSFFGINPPLKTQYFPLNLQKQIPGTANDQFKVGVVMDDLFSVKRPLPLDPFLSQGANLHDQAWQ